MNCQFIEQVETLMQMQQIKCADAVGNSNYSWLNSKNKRQLRWLSAKEEYLIRQGIRQIKEEQKVSILRQLCLWLDEHPSTDYSQVPEMCVHFLNRMETRNSLQRVTLSRISSFRNSLRKFSILTNNKISPNTDANTKPRRSVTFNDEPVVYSIYI